MRSLAAAVAAGQGVARLEAAAEDAQPGDVAALGFVLALEGEGHHRAVGDRA